MCIGASLRASEHVCHRVRVYLRVSCVCLRLCARGNVCVCASVCVCVCVHMYMSKRERASVRAHVCS